MRETETEQGTNRDGDKRHRKSEERQRKMRGKETGTATERGEIVRDAHACAHQPPLPLSRS